MRLRKHDVMRAGDDAPLELFKQGIRAEATQQRYLFTLRKITCEFLEEILTGSFEERVLQLVQRGRDDPIWTRDLLIGLSRKLRERTKLDKDDKEYLNPATIPNYFKPIKKLFDMNDVLISWKRVYATFPEMDNMSESTGWTRDEIAKMLLHAYGLQYRALILVLASSGVRIGAVPQLNWGDIEPIYRADGKLTLESDNGELVCAALHVYRGSAESYIAFITPEAFNALQVYGQSVADNVGRPARSKDPIFTTIRGGVPTRVNYGSINKQVDKIVSRSGLREAKQGKNYRVPLMNGFRRFFNKTCKGAISEDSTLSSLIKKEYMMGHHGLTTLDENYFKTDILELAVEYMVAVPDLTIDDTDRLLRSNRVMASKIEKLENEKKILEHLAHDMKELRDDCTSMRQEISELKKKDAR